MRYDQAWCDALTHAVGSRESTGDTPLRLLFVVTDTDEGKVAFSLDIDIDIESEGISTATAGKLPRGEKADVTVTVKEPVLLEIWLGNRTRDEAFMRGDLKIEGAYHRWLDVLVPLFETPTWQSAWGNAAA